jgi:hypothetical protein
MSPRGSFDGRKGPNMKQLLALAAMLSLGCAVPPGAVAPLSIPIWVRSHNQSIVDVYLLCGDRDAELLGSVASKGTEAFEIPTSRARCIYGLNFFLVHRNMNRGYWVGPFRPQAGSVVQLVIEKYAGLSAASLVNGEP